MPIRLLPSLMMLILAWGFSPGPANIYAMGSAIVYGRQKALKMWLGLLTGFSIAVSLAAVVTHLYGTEIGSNINLIKYTGVCYLLWLAYRTWRSTKNEKKATTSCTFIDGMIMQLTNAKIILFDFMVFSIYVLPYSNRLIDLFSTSAVLLIAGPGANLFWLLLGSTMNKVLAKHQKSVNTILSILLALCALMIIFK